VVREFDIAGREDDRDSESTRGATVTAGPRARTEARREGNGAYTEIPLYARIMRLKGQRL
jgi:hypothetical protein